MKYSQLKVLIIPLSFLMLAAIACSLNPLANGEKAPAEVGTLVSTAAPIIMEDQVDTESASSATGDIASNTSVPQDQVLQADQPLLVTSELEQKLIELYQQVNSSVVHILVYADRNDFLPLGSGSGFIYDDEGRIVTNNHVVADGEDFEVVFADGNRSWAEIVGTDVDSDLAVIQVDELPETALPVLLGDSDDLRVGQFVIAIGNPFGEQGSMSLGIISGLGRSLESQRSLDNSPGRYSLPQVVQTDAPINPGNSGGPLIDLEGNVVGVNSAIRTTTGVNSGVGFSIPVNAVHRIIPKLIEEGRYIYSYMGVQIQSLNLTLQERLGLSKPVGAYVTGVTPDSPAEEAGLIAARDSDGRGGDIILEINGEPIRDTEELIAYLVFHTDVGDTIELTVERDGEMIIVPLTLGERP